MKIKSTQFLYLVVCFAIFFGCKEEKAVIPVSKELKSTENIEVELPKKNKEIVEIVQKYGPEISPTYEKAVCTELVIQVLEKIQNLNDQDKSRIRIITKSDIQGLMQSQSPIPKGVYYALTEKGVGIPIDNRKDVLEGDFVQFWTSTWGHCGIVKSIDVEKNQMVLYSSYPSTNGYGIQTFNIPDYTYFVRLK